VNKTGLIIFIIGFFTMAGCTTKSTIAQDHVWPDNSSMTRLERDVQESCDSLVKNVSPGSVFISWVDNIHPNAPLLSEAYMVSMYERSLLRRGFSIKGDEELAKYKLNLTMTPSRKSTLVLATISKGDGVVATKESHFTNGSETWSKALGSYRLRTKTRIALGSAP
jgi:hypothetical protein